LPCPQVTATTATTPGSGSLSGAKSAQAGQKERKKRFDKPEGQSSRREAVVCDAPEAMGRKASKPGRPVWVAPARNNQPGTSCRRQAAGVNGRTLYPIKKPGFGASEQSEVAQ